MNNLTVKNEATELGTTLLEIAMLLMVSGASTGRVRNTIGRISNRFGTVTYLLISQRTIIISVYNDEEKCVFNGFKRTSPHRINFSILSAVSRLSWQVVEEKWSVQQIYEAIEKLNAPHYSRILILALTGLSGASFCRLNNGAPIDMIFTFMGTVTGLFVLQEAGRLRFNPNLCVYFAALSASLVAGSLFKFTAAPNHEIAQVTSILFLIPGVALINAFADMIDGNLQNGLIRGLHGLIISFSIALGLFTSIAIYQF